MTRAIALVGLAGSQTVAGANAYRVGADYVAPSAVGHRITEAGIEIIAPRRALTDEEARKLAWGILADLAPEDVGPTPEIVTYKEACRQSVLRALEAGPARMDEIASALGWQRRSTERRVYELIEDGRVERDRIDHHLTFFRLARAERINTKSGT